MEGSSDSIADRTFALHSVKPDLIPSISLWLPQTMAEVITECIARSDS